MPEGRNICPRMSGVLPNGTGELGGSLVAVVCKKDDCALWDPLLKCCSYVSHLVEGRTNIREIVAGLVAGFQEDQVTAEGKLIEVEKKYVEALQFDTADDVMEGHRERIGELKGKIDVIGQMCEILKRRFMV